MIDSLRALSPRHAVAICVVLAGIAVGVQAGLRHRALCPPIVDLGPRADRFEPLASGEEAILVLGDTLLTVEGLAAADPRCGGPERGHEAILPLLQSADAVAIVGNLEGPLSDGPPPSGRRKGLVAPTSVAPALADVFTHVSLANNHALDREMDGLRGTRDVLEDVGLVGFGAGENLSEALRAARIEVGGASVAILGAMNKGRSQQGWEATDAKGGVLVLDEPYLEGAFAAAADADLVILLPHGGGGYKPVRDDQREQAARALAWGADAIVGHGSHAAQSFEVRDGVPLIWSLGNGVFQTRGAFGGKRHGHGLVARLVFADGALVRAELVPIRVNNRLVGFRPEPCPRDEADEVLARLAVGPGIRIERGVATLDLSARASPAPSAD